MKNPSDSESEVWTVSKLIAWTSEYFQSRSIEGPRMGAELLLAHCLGIRRIDLYLQFDKPLTKSELDRFKSMIRRRVNREPVAYITGTRGFWDLDLQVSPDVLIPRPDTECLVEAALAVIPNNPADVPFRVLDLGTGSGAIILSLASERRTAVRCYAVDISHHATVQAAGNRDANGLSDDVVFMTGRWFGPFRKTPMFDVIVSNPPYIPTADIEGLEPEIRNHEPILALDGDADGLMCIREILNDAPDYLKDGGYLLIETGFDQKENVESIARKVGCYEGIEYIKDYAGHNRVVKMRKIRSSHALSK